MHIIIVKKNVFCTELLKMQCVIIKITHYCEIAKFFNFLIFNSHLCEKLYF